MSVSDLSNVEKRGKKRTYFFGDSLNVLLILLGSLLLTFSTEHFTF